MHISLSNFLEIRIFYFASIKSNIKDYMHIHYFADKKIDFSCALVSSYDLAKCGEGRALGTLELTHRQLQCKLHCSRK